MIYYNILINTIIKPYIAVNTLNKIVILLNNNILYLIALIYVILSIKYSNKDIKNNIKVFILI